MRRNEDVQTVESLIEELRMLLDAGLLDRLEDRSQGFSGAEVQLLCRRVRWARRGKGSDVGDDLEALVDRVRPRTAAATLEFLPPLPPEAVRE